MYVWIPAGTAAAGAGARGERARWLAAGHQGARAAFRQPRRRIPLEQAGLVFVTTWKHCKIL